MVPGVDRPTAEKIAHTIAEYDEQNSPADEEESVSETTESGENEKTEE